ncbi:LPS O-antigen length regulator [Sesbania bispinosa]|nr:LPS O-antigen length regulator [Sesbania bispinosa]
MLFSARRSLLQSNQSSSVFSMRRHPSTGSSGGTLQCDPRIWSANAQQAQAACSPPRDAVPATSPVYFSGQRSSLLRSHFSRLNR